MSMLRSSKFLRYFISFARNIVITRPNDVDNTLLRNSKILANSTYSYATQPVSQHKNIDKYIQRLDQDVRRSGRISKRELEEVFNEIRHSKHATSTQSLMIIRCCGNLVPEESPELRTQLVNKIWSTFENIGVPLDISHYNALLRVYLENEHHFSPSEFLADLQNKGVEPNRVTYQRLISSYCQRGDIDGATRILEYMKEKQIPVNENVFNSLIMGHFQADDIQSALGILGVMKQANISPSSDTYTTLMCGHAKNGDYAAINEILSQCKKEDVEISDNDILEVMYTLAVNKHMDFVEQLGNIFAKNPGFNQDVKNVIIRLIVKGEHVGAIKLFRIMVPITSAEGETVQIGSFLIRQMVKSGIPFENIVEFCNELKASGENEYGLFIATETSLSYGTPEMSLKLLTLLSKEHEVCHHYYWPVLVQYGKTRNLQGVTNTLLQMVVEIGQPVSGETLRDYVIPYLPQNEDSIHLLRQAGIPLATSAAAMIGNMLIKNDINNAAKLGMKFRANYTSVQLRKNVVSSFIETKDLKSFITLVRIIEESSKEENNELAGSILLDLVHSLRHNRTETIISVLKAYLDSGLAISSKIAENLQNVLNGEELTSEIVELLSNLSSPDLTPIELQRPAFVQTNVLDNAYLIRRIKLASDKGDPAWGLKRQLLGNYCSNKDIEKAEQLKKEMDDGGFECLIGVNVMMMDLYIHHEKLQEALGYYNKIFENGDEGTEIDTSKILKLGALMLKNNMIQEAIDLFSRRKLNPESQMNKTNNHVTFAWRCLNILAENKDVENLQSVLKVLIDNNFIIPNNVILGPLIKVHLLRDDIESAFNAFEECCTKYRATPWKNELACKLIQNEDPVTLQKLTDLSTQIHGEINSLYDLVLAFVECGRIRQARKILETPGLRSRTHRLNSACERYGNEGHAVHLESLVEATKDMYHIDRADIYYHLLSTYCKSDEVDKAMGLWTQMQDEDVQPTDQFLLKLGNFLKEHNRPVPFAIPTGATKEVVQTQKDRPQANHQNLVVRTFRSAMNSNNIEEALSSLKKLNNFDLTNGDRSKLLTLLVKNGRLGEAKNMLIEFYENNSRVNIRVLSLVINELAKIGDIDSLNVIGQYIDEEVKKMTSFTNRLVHCLVEAGKAEEVLTMLESKIKAATTDEEIKKLQEEFPRGGIFSVFQSCPELIPKVEEISVLYREKGILAPTNSLWAHYTVSGNSDKAKEAWSFLKPSEKLMFQPILKEARKTGNLSLVSELLALCKASKLSPESLGVIYSSQLTIAFSLGKIEECEQILENGIKDCTIDNINKGILTKLKQSFEINGKEFKYTIPASKKMSSKQSSSSSSSDSDSDNERTVKKASN